MWVNYSYCEIICFLPEIIGGLCHSGLPLMKMRHFWPLQTLRSNCFLKLQCWYQDGRVLNIELHFLFWSQQVQISILQIWIKRYKWNGFLQETNLFFLFSGKIKNKKISVLPLNPSVFDPVKIFYQENLIFIHPKGQLSIINHSLNLSGPIWYDRNLFMTLFINLLDVYSDAAFYVLGIWAVEE